MQQTIAALEQELAAVTSSSDKKEFGPSVAYQIFMLCLGVVFVAMGFTLAVIIPDQEMIMVVVGISCLAMGVIGVSLASFNMMMGEPRLTLSTKGLGYSGSMRQRLYKWDEVGEISLQIQKVNFVKNRYVCAYSKINHDALMKTNPLLEAGLYDADIRLMLTGLRIGRSDEEALGLVDEINQWRLKYGSDEDAASDISADEIEALRKRKLRSTWMTVILIFLFIAAGFGLKIWLKL